MLAPFSAYYFRLVRSDKHMIPAHSPPRIYSRSASIIAAHYAPRRGEEREKKEREKGEKKRRRERRRKRFAL